MASNDISRIILEELSKIIASKIDTDIAKIDNKLVEYGISNPDARKLLIKKLISNGNISEAFLLEDSKAIAALAKEIPKDPAELTKLRKLYTTGNEQTKRDIEAALRKHYLTKIYTKGDEEQAGSSTLGAGKQSSFRSKINKIVGLDTGLLGKIVQYPTAKDAEKPDKPAKASPEKAKAEKPAKQPKEPAVEKPTPAADPDLEYLNKIQNMTPGDLRKLGMSLSKNRTERDKVISALRKAPGAAGKILAKKLNISPGDISGEKKPTDAKPPAPAAPTATQKPATKEPATPAAAPTTPGGWIQTSGSKTTS